MTAFLFERDRQIRLETWTEYQNYHFMYHEELEQKREGQKERLVKLREIAAESTESLSDIKFALAFQPGNVERSIQRVENHQLLPLRCPPPGMPPPRCAPSGAPARDSRASRAGSPFLASSPIIETPMAVTRALGKSNVPLLRRTAKFAVNAII
ncbi:hypothetical protein CHU98_g11452 [Xylaria longipes]|nr:hypothetical protein CHU98_g11452 [Xylaria longipes]